MKTLRGQCVASAAFGLLLAGGVGCSAKRQPVTVEDLMEDRVALDGVLLKCNEDPVRARSDMDCLNARIAIERLANQVDPAEAAKRNAEFERSREKLRLDQERARQVEDAKSKVDPYNLPMVPVDSAPATAPAAAGTGASGLAQTKN